MESEKELNMKLFKVIKVKAYFCVWEKNLKKSRLVP